MSLLAGGWRRATSTRAGGPPRRDRPAQQREPAAPPRADGTRAGGRPGHSTGGGARRPARQAPCRTPHTPTSRYEMYSLRHTTRRASRSARATCGGTRRVPSAILAPLDCDALRAKPGNRELVDRVWQRGGGSVRRLAATLVLAIALTGCGTSGSNPAASASVPRPGLSRSQAYAAALENARPGTRAVGGSAGLISHFVPNWQGRDEWVWAVVLSGSFPLSAGPSTGGPGPTPATRETVILDYRTGQFILTEVK